MTPEVASVNSTIRLSGWPPGKAVSLNGWPSSSNSIPPGRRRRAAVRLGHAHRHRAGQAERHVTAGDRPPRMRRVAPGCGRTSGGPAYPGGGGDDVVAAAPGDLDHRVTRSRRRRPARESPRTRGGRAPRPRRSPFLAVGQLDGDAVRAGVPGTRGIVEPLGRPGEPVHACQFGRLNAQQS